MNTPLTGSIVENASLLIGHFGIWPSFHDAEIIDLYLWRGQIQPGDWDDRNVFPVLTMKILVLGAAQTMKGKPNIEATLRFHDLTDVKLEAFNHVNQIIDLTVSVEPRGTFTTGEPLPPYLAVTVTSGLGMAVFFRCFRIEILNAMRAST